MDLRMIPGQGIESQNKRASIGSSASTRILERRSLLSAMCPSSFIFQSNIVCISNRSQRQVTPHHARWCISYKSRTSILWIMKETRSSPNGDQVWESWQKRQGQSWYLVLSGSKALLCLSLRYVTGASIVSTRGERNAPALHTLNDTRLIGEGETINVITTTDRQLGPDSN